MPRAFTDQEKQAIIRKLLDQGGLLFSTAGLQKTTIEELARSAGISKAAFYLFYPSKEALFMDVVEQAEIEFRKVILQALRHSSGSPRSRLLTVLTKAYRTWKDIPVLRFFTSTDYEQLTHRIPVDKIQEHVHSDFTFMQEFTATCHAEGIPVVCEPDQLTGLLLTLFITVLHEDDMGAGQLTPSIDIIVELISAFCLGEIDLMRPVTSQPTLF
ncbi:MAG: TetR/AcrR family transcriptional regulator [Anaerolineae bacterium]|nr:TetR/AcrR family transcriptional regulator [Anaerolineae bacterium]